MQSRAREIVQTLGVCLLVSLGLSILKIFYGSNTGTLAFIADGIHSLSDSAATLLGIVSVIFSSQPPDEGHPYGHQKIETVAALILALLLFFAAWEVGHMAYERILTPDSFPRTTPSGFAIVVGSMLLNLAVSRWEAARAAKLKSSFLATDSVHNRSDFLISLAVMITLISIHFRIPYVDSVSAVAIAIYLAALATKLLVRNFQPLVDHSVLDIKIVEEIANGTTGVIHCHNIRSRGDNDRQFLDLNLHLPGDITLERAHEISHEVEAKLRAAFPGLMDVVIHTEPHDHGPCLKE